METVEAGPGTVRRVTPSGCERRPGRSNGGQRSWSLAAGGLARAQPRIAQCLLRLARDSTIDCETYRLTRRTAGCGPACPVVWEGRSCEASPYPDCGCRYLSCPVYDPPQPRRRQAVKGEESWIALPPNDQRNLFAGDSVSECVALVSLVAL